MRLKVKEQFLTEQFLREHRACQDGFRYWCEQKKPHLLNVKIAQNDQESDEKGQL